MSDGHAEAALLKGKIPEHWSPLVAGRDKKLELYLGPPGEFQRIYARRRVRGKAGPWFSDALFVLKDPLRLLMFVARCINGKD